MEDIERLAAENARLKQILAKQGFKLAYKRTGEIDRVIAPRRPTVKHTAATWAKKRGYKGSMALVRKITKNQAVTQRKFKNAVERANLIQEAKAYLTAQGYKIPEKFFNKVPTYALKNNDFYENVNAILNSMAKGDDAKEITQDEIAYSMQTTVQRIRKVRSETPAASKNVSSSFLETRKKIQNRKQKPKLKFK